MSLVVLSASQFAANEVTLTKSTNAARVVSAKLQNLYAVGTNFDGVRFGTDVTNYAATECVFVLVMSELMRNYRRKKRERGKC